MGRSRSLVGVLVGIVLGVGLVFGYLQLQGVARADRPATASPPQVPGAAPNNQPSTASSRTNGASPSVAGGVAPLIAGEEALIRVYEETAPSIVQITTSRAVVPGSPFEQPIEGLGSGFIIDADGHILTNNHVAAGVDEVDVTLADGDTVPGRVVGRDPGDDVAVVKIDVDRSRIRPVRLGDSSQLRVGQLVVAIGNPFRFERSMTSGIVSAVGRTFSEVGRQRPLRNLIQTDAAINPGNSGGPLLNSAGEVIGINTAIENPTGNRVFVGLGFAIPINAAKASLPAMLRGDRVQHPWLGISGRQVTPTFTKDTGLSVNQGIYVIQVVPDSPAGRAGLKGAFAADADLQGAPRVPSGGDIILAIDGRAVSKIEELVAYLETKRVGDSVTLRLVRDGTEQEVKVTLEAWPERALEAMPRETPPRRPTPSPRPRP